MTAAVHLDRGDLRATPDDEVHLSLSKSTGWIESGASADEQQW
jgi:hypothetical protein